MDQQEGGILWNALHPLEDPEVPPPSSEGPGATSIVSGDTEASLKVSLLCELLWKRQWEAASAQIIEAQEDETRTFSKLPCFSNGACGLPLHLVCAMRPMPPFFVVEMLLKKYPEAAKQKASMWGLLPLHMAADLRKPAQPPTQYPSQPLMRKHLKTHAAPASAKEKEEEKEEDHTEPTAKDSIWSSPSDAATSGVEEEAAPSSNESQSMIAATDSGLSSSPSQSVCSNDGSAASPEDKNNLKDHDVSLPTDHCRVVQLLLEAYPNALHAAEEFQGMLPIHIAASTTPAIDGKIPPSSAQIAQLLIEHAPDTLSARDHAGDTPLDLAQRSNQRASTCSQSGCHVSRQSSCSRTNSVETQVVSLLPDWKWNPILQTAAVVVSPPRINATSSLLVGSMDELWNEPSSSESESESSISSESGDIMEAMTSTTTTSEEKEDDLMELDWEQLASYEADLKQELEDSIRIHCAKPSIPKTVPENPVRYSQQEPPFLVALGAGESILPITPPSAFETAPDKEFRSKLQSSFLEGDEASSWQDDEPVRLLTATPQETCSFDTSESLTEAAGAVESHVRRLLGDAEDMGQFFALSTSSTGISTASSQDEFDAELQHLPLAEEELRHELESTETYSSYLTDARSFDSATGIPDQDITGEASSSDDLEAYKSCGSDSETRTEKSPIPRIEEEGSNILLLVGTKSSDNTTKNQFIENLPLKEEALVADYSSFGLMDKVASHNKEYAISDENEHTCIERSEKDDSGTGSRTALSSNHETCCFEAADGAALPAASNHDVSGDIPLSPVVDDDLPAVSSNEPEKKELAALEPELAINGSCPISDDEPGSSKRPRENGTPPLQNKKQLPITRETYPSVFWGMPSIEESSWDDGGSEISWKRCLNSTVAVTPANTITSSSFPAGVADKAAPQCHDVVITWERIHLKSANNQAAAPPTPIKSRGAGDAFKAPTVSASEYLTPEKQPHGNTNATGIARRGSQEVGDSAAMTDTEMLCALFDASPGNLIQVATHQSGSNHEETEVQCDDATPGAIHLGDDRAAATLDTADSTQSNSPVPKSSINSEQHPKQSPTFDGVLLLENLKSATENSFADGGFEDMSNGGLGSIKSDLIVDGRDIEEAIEHASSKGALSELLHQLQRLKEENKAQTQEVERLRQQVSILSEIKGVSVDALRDSTHDREDNAFTFQQLLQLFKTQEKREANRRDQEGLQSRGGRTQQEGGGDHIKSTSHSENPLPATDVLSHWYQELNGEDANRWAISNCTTPDLSPPRIINTSDGIGNWINHLPSDIPAQDYPASVISAKQKTLADVVAQVLDSPDLDASFSDWCDELVKEGSNTMITCMRQSKNGGGTQSVLAIVPSWDESVDSIVGLEIVILEESLLSAEGPKNSQTMEKQFTALTLPEEPSTAVIASLNRQQLAKKSELLREIVKTSRRRRLREIISRRTKGRSLFEVKETVQKASSPRRQSSPSLCNADSLSMTFDDLWAKASSCCNPCAPDAPAGKPFQIQRVPIPLVDLVPDSFAEMEARKKRCILSSDTMEEIVNDLLEEERSIVSTGKFGEVPKNSTPEKTRRVKVSVLEAGREYSAEDCQTGYENSQGCSGPSLQNFLATVEKIDKALAQAQAQSSFWSKPAPGGREEGSDATEAACKERDSLIACTTLLKKEREMLVRDDIRVSPGTLSHIDGLLSDLNNTIAGLSSHINSLRKWNKVVKKSDDVQDMAGKNMNGMPPPKNWARQQQVTPPQTETVAPSLWCGCGILSACSP